MINFPPFPVHTAPRLFADPNVLNSQKNRPALTSKTIESPPPSKQNVSPILSRSRRDLQNPAPKAGARVESIQKFAEALVERDDRELAKNVANSLIRQRLASETRSPGDGQEKVGIPPHSTFGKLWSELADALESEPFKSFAEAKLLDISKLIIGGDGDLHEKSDGALTHVFEQDDPEWSAASGAVLAAAKKLMTSRYPEVSFYGRDQALAQNVAEFYGLQLGSITSNDTLSAAGRLLHEGGFNALSSSNPFDAPIKQRQREAQQRIADLAPRALSDLLESFTPLTAQEKIQAADKELAQLASQGLMKLLPESNEYETSVTLPDIPEYSTFNLVRKNLLTALTGSTFTTFAQDNKLDPTSVRINPVSGVLTGQVNGVNTTFSLNDVSGWADIWVEIQDAVQQMAAGSEDDVTYPTRKSALLFEVMAFYNEPPPHQENDQRRGWEQRQLVNTLGRIDEMSQNKGFKALIDPAPSDPACAAVKRNQQAMTEQLADMPLSPSSLETLAAAVKANTITPVEVEEPRTAVLANAESELATTLHRAMLELKTTPSQATSKTIQPIPTNSQFGQWWDYLGKALKGHGFIEWASQQNIDLASLQYDPTDKALIAKVNGVEQRFTATDFGQKYPEHFDVLTPVLAAAQAFAAHGQPITLPHAGNNSVPYQWVANFYGINGDPSSSEFEQQIALMGRTQQFPEKPGNLQKVVAWLNRQKTVLGDSNDRYALVAQLKKGEVDNDDTRFVVDPESSHQPKGVTTVGEFLSQRNAYPVTSQADRDNLLSALLTPIPQAPPLGDHGGFLTTQVSLNTAQRSDVSEAVKNAIAPHDTLLSYLRSAVTDLSADPAQALDQLLSSDNALELASSVQTTMKGAPTLNSLKQWLLTALVLELDPTAGTQRDKVAGYDFKQSGNWGVDTHTLRERFLHHLGDEKKIPPDLVPVIGQLLLKVAAPYLNVKDAPSIPAYTSIEWVTFTAAVNQIELTAPGATANMTAQKIIDFHKIKPISAEESKHQAIALMNPVIDWAIANNHLAKSDKDEYTLEQYQSSLEKLDAQIKEVSAGKNFLHDVQPPARRKRSLALLREKLGAHVDLTGRYVQMSYLGGLVGTRIISIVEAYEAGLLGQPLSYHGPAGITAAELNRVAATLPAVTEQFDKDIAEDYTLRRKHTVNVFKNMLSQLSLADRDAINNGEVEIYKAEGAGNGIVLVTNYEGVNRAFAIYPAAGKIVNIPDIDRAVPYGKPGMQTIDAQAFKNPPPGEKPSEPKPGVRSQVVLTHLGQGSLVDDFKSPGWRSLIAHSETPDHSAYGSKRIQHLAEVLVDTVYLNKPSFIYAQRGPNRAENFTKPADVLEGIFEGVLGLVPGGLSVLYLFRGEYAKAVLALGADIIIYATTAGLGKLWTFAKEGVGWGAAKASSKVVEDFGAEGAESIALKDFTATSTAQSNSALSRLQNSHLVEATADMADGSVVRAGTQEQVKVTAVNRAGSWYAYDASTETAYGPALKDFVSETSSVLRRETFSDGTQALVADKSLAADAFTLPRTNGFDVVNEGKVYRYDARKPGVLTDLASADHYKPLEGFEALCPAPSVGSGRVKRGSSETCFPKVIENVSGALAQELQSLEHVCLFPSPPKLFKKDQFVIFERRRFKMTESETGPRLTPTLDKEPITYKTQIQGSLKHDPNFGFYGAPANGTLAQETRVVKLNSISPMCDDKREVRGVIVNSQVAGSTDKYLVIEADTAEFYYAKLDSTATGELTFLKCSPSELPYVQSYRNKFSIRQGMPKVPFDANFIAMPTLEQAFAQLLEKGEYSKADVDELRAWCKDKTPQEHREVIYQLQRTEAIGKANIALRPTQVRPLTKPVDFATWPAEQQNKFYAQQAKNSVNRSMKATGLGPSNKVFSKADIKRSEAANMTLTWLRRTAQNSAQNHSNLILKAGVGNCGEMALVAKDIITKSGGRAYEWHASQEHVLTVIGGPSELPAGTVDFSGDAWKDAWIVDPWADVACPAREYTRRIDEVMTQWARENVKIRTGPKQFISPRDQNWLDALVSKPKTPYSHGYNRQAAP